MEMPRPTEQHRKLQALVGDWVGEETLHPTPGSPHGGNATTRIRSRIDLDGFFLVTDHEQKRGGQVTYRGHGVLGWDHRQQRYTMHWFDIMGGDPGAPALGTWDGNKLCFQHQHHMGHSRYTYGFEHDGKYTLKIEFSQDGRDWMPFLDGNYTRTS